MSNAYRERLQMAKITLSLDDGEVAMAVREMVSKKQLLPQGAKIEKLTVHLNPETLKKLMSTASNHQRELIDLHIGVRIHAKIQTMRSKLVEMDLAPEP